MLPVSLTFAAALALLNLFLAYRIVRVRIATKTMNGDGGHPLLQGRTRAQANFVEYAPFALGLVVLLELARRPHGILWAITALFVAGRIAHAFGLERPAPNPLRAGGILVTWVVLLGLAGWAIVVASTPMPGATVTYM
ncbi:MAPEG family protein [Sphingomonas sp.]|uniref:MAPEG family protein n=1 Tax=Sphingomonas sp. TaxID=28214 RepID=UPI003AFF7115